MTRLKHERQIRGFNQTELAAATGLHQGDISQIERGVLIPSEAQLERLAAVLSVPAGDLLKEVVVIEARA